MECMSKNGKVNVTEIMINGNKTIEVVLTSVTSLITAEVYSIVL